MIYTSYYPENGTIIGTINSSEPKNLPKYNTYVIPGQYDAKIYYIKNKKAKVYPAKPNNSYWVVWTWDLESETWSPNISASGSTARAIRNEKLLAVDRVNPIWWESMSETDKTQVKLYREQLLNVPDQPGFPVEIEWPVKPAWL